VILKLKYAKEIISLDLVELILIVKILRDLYVTQDSKHVSKAMRKKIALSAL